MLVDHIECSMLLKQTKLTKAKKSSDERIHEPSILVRLFSVYPWWAFLSVYPWWAFLDSHPSCPECQCSMWGTLSSEKPSLPPPESRYRLYWCYHHLNYKKSLNVLKRPSIITGCLGCDDQHRNQNMNYRWFWGVGDDHHDPNRPGIQLRKQYLWKSTLPAWAC